MAKPKIKLRHFPGTVSKNEQIKLVESDKRSIAKKYKKFLVKQANRKSRHNKNYD